MMRAGLAMIKTLIQGFLNGHPQIKKAVEKIGKIFTTVFKPVIKIIKSVIDWWKKLLGQKKEKKFSVSAPFSKAIQSIKDVFGKWKDVLGQTAKKTFEAAKKRFDSVVDGMKSLYNKWKDILGQKSKKTFTTTYKTKGKPSKSNDSYHRIGLREVPYDGYSAILHKGEAIMTAAEVNKLKKMGEKSVNGSGDLTVNVYGSNNMDVNQLAAAVERRIIQVQKRRSAAWV